MSVFVLCILSLLVSYQTLSGADNTASEAMWKSALMRGLDCYRNKELDGAIVAFKEALASALPQGSSNAMSQDEKALLSLFDGERAALARYQLGLVYESQGKLEQAAVLFRDALAIISTQGARYLGYKDGCKSCHYKEWKSWKSTKMAKAFETLKPGESAESKTNRGLDPRRDYTHDPNCLACHTTGFGLPGGYQIPDGLPYKVRKAAEQTKGGTCEACHGPGSIYGPVHKDVDDKARAYTPEEFFAVGEYDVNAKVCARCHNRRDPNAGPDFSFNFKEKKDKDTHENFDLKYRVKDEQTAAGDGQKH